MKEIEELKKEYCKKKCGRYCGTSCHRIELIDKGVEITSKKWESILTNTTCDDCFETAIWEAKQEGLVK